MRRSFVITGRVCVGVVSGIVMASAVPAQALVAASANGPGGYVAIPAALHSSRLELTVPMLRCDANLGAYRVGVGLYGHEKHAGSVGAWSLVVRLDCAADGTLTTKGVMTMDGSSAVLGVGIGDRVRLATRDATLTVENLTKGRGLGGASEPGAVLGPAVIFGARTSVKLADPVTVRATTARVNAGPISAITHHRQVERLNGAVVAYATPLADDGTFSFRLT